MSAPDVETSKWHRRTQSGANNEATEQAEYTVPVSHEGPGYDVEVPTVTTRKYAVIMVGLPARGKTFLAQKISRYLAWLGHESAVFNVQRMWRESLGVQCPKASPSSSNLYSDGPSNVTATESPSTQSPQGPTHLAAGDGEVKQFIQADTFFQTFATDGPGKQEYDSAINLCVGKVRSFFGRGGLVAFINDDFVTQAARDDVERRLADVADQVLYIEVVRDDASNSRFEDLKVNNPGEYGAIAGTSEAQSDFAKRIALLKSVYEPVSGDKSFIRVRNGSHISLHDVRGYLPSRMTSFLMHLSPQNKVFCPIYFCRHGQSEYNLEDRLGGNPRLTEKGKDDALALKNFVATIKKANDEEIQRQQAEIAERAANSPSTASAPSCSQNTSMGGSVPHGQQLVRPLQIWTSQLTRTIETARPAETELGIQCLRWRNLNEIHAGVCEHLTYAEVKERYPVIHDFRKKNKYAFRYPEGESYQDLVTRLEPVIMELENADRVVIVVAHQAVLRALLAYFGGSNAEHSVHVEVPHRTVWRCSYDGQGIPTIDEMHLPPNKASEEPGTTPMNFVPTTATGQMVPESPKGP